VPAAPVIPVPAAPKTIPVPTEKTAAPKPTEKKAPSIATQIKRSLMRADLNAKREVAKQREAEAKKAKEDAKKVASIKPPQVDAVGIANGVYGGSPKNKEGGAGGNALTVPERTEVEAYSGLLNQKLAEELQAILEAEHIGDGFTNEVDFQVLPDGHLAHARVVKRSGNDAFDAAVLRAINQVKMPARPKGFKQEQVQVPFSSHAK
jgi:TonB family protein